MGSRKFSLKYGWRESARQHVFVNFLRRILTAKMDDWLLLVMNLVLLDLSEVSGMNWLVWASVLRDWVAVETERLSAKNWALVLVVN